MQPLVCFDAKYLELMVDGEAVFRGVQVRELVEQDGEVSNLEVLDDQKVEQSIIQEHLGATGKPPPAYLPLPTDRKIMAPRTSSSGVINFP